MESKPEFNTDHLQNYPDFMLKAPDGGVQKMNNNPRYKYFRQNHFTAGDEDQFLEFWDRSSPSDTIKRNQVNLNKNIPTHENVRWPKYKDLCTENIIQTYHYISDKFKKGIFVKITDGQPKVFLPFSKVDYQNEWHDRIKTNPRHFSSIIDLMKYTASIDKREFVESRVHKNVKSWYGNNGLVRLEFPISEGDSGVNMIHDMFLTLTIERIVPSVELFVNKRDFPLLKKDDTESYNSFYGSRTKLLSHQYSKYAPILSMTTSDVHADIPIPTWEDWSRVAYWDQKKLFGKEFRVFPTKEELNEIPWDKKKPIAIFRGASTGLGTTTENNIRLFLSAESEKAICDEDGLPFLDVGITKWNLRPRKHPNYPYLETILVNKMPFQKKPYMSVLEQASYKYFLHLPGHSEAYRLGLELFTGSVVLYYPCEYQVWFFKWMKPYEHYIPLTGSLDDIYAKIKWCKENDEKCRQIAKNALQFAETFLDKNGILDYLQKLLWDIYAFSGKISFTPKSLIQLNMDLYSRIKHEMFHPIHEFLKDRPHLKENMDWILENNPSWSEFEPETIQTLLYLFAEKHFMHTMKLIHETKKTKLYQIKVTDKIFAVKKSIISWKREEKFEMMTSYLYMNELAKQFPNFVYTYFGFTNKINRNEFYMISDYLEGVTMENFINSKEFQMPMLFDLYFQIVLIIHQAQQHCGFLHMDLYPWNIIIQTLEKEVTVEYELDSKMIQIKTKVIPVIIDYGKSHFIHEGVNYYNTSPFYFCRLQDVISIIFSTLYIILDKQKLSDKDCHHILNIMNFFCNNEYVQKQTFTSIFQVKHFLKKNKKYSIMLSCPKKGMENVSPSQFFYYLYDHCKLPHSIEIHVFDFKKPPFHSSNLNKINPCIKMHFIELDVMKLFLSKFSILEMRQFWLNKEALYQISTDCPFKHYLLIYNLHYMFSVMKKLYESFEKIKMEKIWTNLTIQDLINGHPPIPHLSMDSFLQTFHSMPNVYPIYPIHSCYHCMKKIEIVDATSFEMQYLSRQILYLEGKWIQHDFFSRFHESCGNQLVKKMMMK